MRIAIPGKHFLYSYSFHSDMFLRESKVILTCANDDQDIWQHMTSLGSN